MMRSSQVPVEGARKSSSLIGKRLQITLATAILLVLGLPVWWYTTAVHREKLPFDDVLAWRDHKHWELFDSKVFSENPPGFPEHVVKASPGYSISVTLANANPHTILPSWDVDVIDDYFRPVIKELSIIADFSIDTQVFHFASLLDTPKYDADAATFYIPDQQISQFINPHEWKLDFSATTLPLLNFIIYIPNKLYSPLRIRFANGTYSPTNSVLIPQWGAITIYNPVLSADTTVATLGRGELAHILPVFSAQLNQLLGAPLTHTLSAADVRRLVKLHLSENLHTSLQTLSALSRLVDSIPNMVILDRIHVLVQRSVDLLNQAHGALESNDFESSLVASREALRISEEAFFDPSMLALLYFPDEHKYAIYTPLFLPVVVPVLAGFAQEIKHRRAKR